MNNVKTYIESGILEMYVLGITSGKEGEEVGQMAVHYPSIQREIEEINIALYNYMNFYGIEPSAWVKGNLLALIKDGNL